MFCGFKWAILDWAVPGSDGGCASLLAKALLNFTLLPPFKQAKTERRRPFIISINRSPFCGCFTDHLSVYSGITLRFCWLSGPFQPPGTLYIR